MNNEVAAALKRQIPFIVGGTITGLIMTYYVGFLITVAINSIIWYFISYITYKLIWKKKGLVDQKVLLRFFSSIIKWKLAQPRRQS